MKIKSLSVVFFLMFSVFIYTQDVNIISTGRVIINDTGSWHGEFKAEEHGFLFICQLHGNREEPIIMMNLF